MSKESLQYFADLIEYQGKTIGEKPYILHGERVITFGEYAEATRRVANGLLAQGAQPGDGVAILMTNCPEYLFLFYGLPRGGFYSVPVNVALKGDGLRYILTNSDVKYLAIEDTLYPTFAELEKPVGQIQKVFVRRTTDASLPAGTQDLEELLAGSPDTPSHVMDPDAITYLMYTSGTTGFPKGVVSRNSGGNVQNFMMLAGIMVKPDDVLYTCLPLFHANALILTSGFSMCAGVPFGLEKRFSASKFWEPIRRYGATQFNALGAMIPILMKQPERPDDADNPVRLVNSAACPANLWVPFEKRFGVKIWEAYGAVDGGGVLIFNFGNAPVGSCGKPLPGTEWKLVDDNGKEVPPGQIGELVTKVADTAKRPVEYYKNPEASAKKVRGEWIHSGDLFYADEEGNLFFVDRKTDSMRRRGENISSFEVENIVEKHPSVAECAAFGVPSELGEDEVMIWVKAKEGASLDLKDLMRHCAEHMAYFMVPRFVDVVDDIPRTGTLRVTKSEMKKRGVTERTWDREKEMPDLKLKKP
ncbi:MAG: ATP-dependent acyl-CoA ligase [Candidatus Abyssubacteria bacterium]